MMDLILSWFFHGIAEAFEMACDMFSAVFGFDMTLFTDTFEFAAIAFPLLQKIGLAIALLLSAWQVIVFFTKGAEYAAASPIRAALNALLAVAFIFYGNYLFDIILEFCKYPYAAITSIDGVRFETNVGGSVVAFLRDSFFTGSTQILSLILLLLIAFSFLKLLLEMVERYVVAFVLMFLSPLAASTLASSTTSGIYKKFVTMFISQCLLLFLNAWCLKMACAGLSVGTNSGSVIIPLIMCYSFLRISTKMDSYINQLGLNAAITGGGLGAELFAAGHTMMNMAKGGGNGSGSGAGSKVLGAAKTMMRYSPATAAVIGMKDAAVGAAKGTSEAWRSGGAVKGWKANTEKIGNSFKAGVASAREGWRTSDNLFSNIDRKATGLNKTVAEQASGNFEQRNMRDIAELNQATRAEKKKLRTNKDLQPKKMSEITSEEMEKMKPELQNNLDSASRIASGDIDLAPLANMGFSEEDIAQIREGASQQVHGALEDAGGQRAVKAINKGRTDKRINADASNTELLASSPQIAHDTFTRAAYGKTIRGQKDTEADPLPDSVANQNDAGTINGEQNNEKTVFRIGTDESNKVAAITQGLGLKTSNAAVNTELSEFVKVGFGQKHPNDVPTYEFALNRNGIQAHYTTGDGWQHDMHIVNSRQYQAMNVAEQSKFIEATSANGKRYYVAADKFKYDSKPEKKDEGKNK